jgi:EAL domain-containing protein (putative c-di-GMP-specific phosphodiesterase class I)
VLRNACAQAARWSATGLPVLRVAVNLSRHELEDDGLIGRVQHALSESGLEPSLLQLEIAESAAGGTPDVGPVLDALQRLGVVLTLASERDSDAATRALTWLPFTRIKLRAPLRVQDALAPGILALARSLRVCVVAQCVETEAQAAALSTQGIDELQGFVVGRPSAPRELELRMRHASARTPAAATS